MHLNSFHEFSFKEFRLLKLNFELKRNKKLKKNEDGIDISANLASRYDITDKTKLRVYLGVDICGEDLPFSLNSEIGGLFIFAKQIENTPEIDKIARINCAAIIFPYLREIVADVIRRAGLPELNLPPLNFVDIYNSQNESKKETDESLVSNKVK